MYLNGKMFILSINNMIYPEFLKKGDTIGVCAPSCGITDEVKIRRFKNAKKKLEEFGFDTIFTESVFMADDRGVSADGKQRGKEFMELIENDKVKLISSAAGGDFLMEMLDHINISTIKNNPTWFQGYSDNTHLVHFLTTKCDIASIYGFNYSDFGMEDWQPSVTRGLSVLKGENITQYSFDMFENTWHDDETGLAGYFDDEKVNWVNTRGEDEIIISGRMIGGCLDVISFITGTIFDGTKEFVEKYKEDGFIWYLESFSLNAEELSLTLWRLKKSGYFKYVKGFIFGRPCMFESFTGIDYKRAVLDVLGELDVPIILDACIGHRGPQISIINGAIGNIVSKGGKGEIKLELR